MIWVRKAWGSLCFEDAGRCSQENPNRKIINKATAVVGSDPDLNLLILAVQDGFAFLLALA